jgi:4-hydroxybenzoate polyprenyltransferase
MTEPTASLAQRLWAYQRERFPLGKTALLLAVFASASVTISANLAHRAVPGVATYVVAWTVASIVFFQLRASDEVKDFEDDARFRPERPIPRGLVSLRLIVGLALALGVAAALLTLALDARLLFTLAAVWIWLGLMNAEFFAPRWLKARPFVYLGSHMAIMPLIDLFLTSTEWLPRGGFPPAGLSWFLALSFANGCVLEIGRKVWAPESERVGVETYSSLLGPRAAALLWLAALTAAFVLLVGVGFAANAAAIVTGIGALAFVAAAAVAVRFLEAPDPVAQARIETFAGLWVFVCYAAAGFAPLLGGASSA